MTATTTRSLRSVPSGDDVAVGDTSRDAGPSLAAGGSFEVARGSGIPMPGVQAGAVIDFNKLEAGGSIDIFPSNTPWPKLPMPPLPYPLCNLMPQLSVAVEYAGGGEFGTNPNAYFNLGIKGAVMLTGQIEAGPCKAGLEASLGVSGKLTLRGTQKDWSVEGFMGYTGDLSVVAAAGWASIKYPICSGTIGEMTGIVFGGQGMRVTRSTQPTWQWGGAIQNLINFVKNKLGQTADAGGGGGQSVAAAGAADAPESPDQPQSLAA